jgi:hypothetical protein
MNYIQELEKCKTLKDLLILRNAIVLHIEKLPTCVDNTIKRIEGLFYVKRIDTQVEYLEKDGMFLSQINTSEADLENHTLLNLNFTNANDTH